MNDEERRKRRKLEYGKEEDAKDLMLRPSQRREKRTSLLISCVDIVILTNRKLLYESFVSLSNVSYGSGLRDIVAESNGTWTVSELGACIGAFRVFQELLE
ncbi:hypothetical protein Pfo_022374, partial [Paulownia fortunei]